MQVTMRNWYTTHGAVQGSGHAEHGLPCQDKTAARSENGCHVIVLADGAGSARLSHYGAERVCDYMSGYLCGNFDALFAMTNAAEVSRQLTEDIYAELCLLAEQLECEPRDLASTLLVAAVKDERYMIIHLGDGVIAYRKGGVLRTATRPDNGEFANTTTFTTSRNASAMQLLKGRLREIDGFALMSDGSAAGLYDKRRNLPAPVLGRIMDYCTYYAADAMEELLTESLECAVKACTRDDCSLAFLAAELTGYRGVILLPYGEQCQLLGLVPHKPHTRRRLKKALAVLDALQQGEQKLRELARRTRITPKYLSRPLQLLLQARLVKLLPEGRYASCTGEADQDR